MKYRHGILLFVAVCATLSPAQAQWWGSDSLPGNAGNYTYRTRLGYWQFGGELRNIATPQAFADRGIIRNWQDGMPVAVDRNLPGGRFAQPGVPNLVYVPRINYFDDLGYLTDFQFREGLRQYWPEDGRLLIDEWEEITHEPERLPPDTTMTGVSPREFTKNVQPPIIVVTSPQQKSIKPQAIVIKRISPERPQKKLTYHQQIMRRHAERRAAEEERLQQQIEQRTQLAQIGRAHV